MPSLHKGIQMIAKDLPSHPVLGTVFHQWCEKRKVQPTKRQARLWLAKYGHMYGVAEQKTVKVDK